MTTNTHIENQPQKNDLLKVPVKIPNTSGDPIDATIFGNGSNIVILSNMDPNDWECWTPLIYELVTQGYSVLSYAYKRKGAERLEDLLEVIAFAQHSAFSKMVLVGASRGGVISLQAAANNANAKYIVGVAALSAPIQYEGVTFYSTEELRSISVPKLLINSEGDESANDTRKMGEEFIAPKFVSFYPGHEHGTDILNDPGHKKALIKELSQFVSSSFRR